MQPIGFVRPFFPILVHERLKVGGVCSTLPGKLLAKTSHIRFITMCGGDFPKGTGQAAFRTMHQPEVIGDMHFPTSSLPSEEVPGQWGCQSWLRAQRQS